MSQKVKKMNKGEEGRIFSSLNYEQSVFLNTSISRAFLEGILSGVKSEREKIGKAVNTRAYEEVLHHRALCDKWTKTFCLDCFGGGLNIFTQKLLEEKLERET